MHYKNGREARDGDPVIGKAGGVTIVGKIHSLNPGSTTCNGQVAVPIIGGMTQWYITVGDFYHADDALAAIENTAGNKPAPDSSPTGSGNSA